MAYSVYAGLNVGEIFAFIQGVMEKKKWHCDKNHVIELMNQAHLEMFMESEFLVTFWSTPTVADQKNYVVNPALGRVHEVAIVTTGEEGYKFLKETSFKKLMNQYQYDEESSTSTTAITLDSFDYWAFIDGYVYIYREPDSTAYTLAMMGVTWPEEKSADANFFQLNREFYFGIIYKTLEYIAVLNGAKQADVLFYNKLAFPYIGKAKIMAQKTNFKLKEVQPYSIL